MPLGTTPKVEPTQYYKRVTRSVAMPIKHHNEIKPALPLAPGTGLHLVLDYGSNSTKVRGNESSGEMPLSSRRSTRTVWPPSNRRPVNKGTVKRDEAVMCAG